MQAVRWIAGCMAVLLLPFVVYNTYSAFGWAYSNAFFNTAHWVQDGWARSAGLITPVMEWSYFVVWILPPLFGAVTMVAAIVTFAMIARGSVFSVALWRGLRWLGVGVFMSALTQLFGYGITPVIMSWNNPVGIAPFRFVYDSAQIGLMFCGVAFWIVGKVLEVAAAEAVDARTFK